MDISDNTVVMGLALSSQETNISTLSCMWIIYILGNLDILEIFEVCHGFILMNLICIYILRYMNIFVSNELSLVVNILKVIWWSPLGLIDILDRRMALVKVLLGLGQHLKSDWWTWDLWLTIGSKLMRYIKIKCRKIILTFCGVRTPLLLLGTIVGLWIVKFFLFSVV